MGSRIGPGSRAAGALRQLGEYLLAAILTISALHAPAGALLLLGGAIAVAGWAAVHDAPLGVIRAVHTRLHRVGLVALAGGLVILVVLSGRIGDLFVAGPALFVAVLLLQLARARPASAAAPPPAVIEPAPHPDRAPLPLARMTGIAAGRAGNLARAQVERVGPIGARQAGRLVGRRIQRRPPP